MKYDRRDFLKAGVAAAAMLQPSRVLGANDRVRVAVIGLRGRGLDHLKTYKQIANVEVAAVCDIDENVTTARLADIERLGMPRPKTYVDIRKVLEDKSIDAVSVATPNHWHSLMGIWAVQAGKDAYIEKPFADIDVRLRSWHPEPLDIREPCCGHVLVDVADGSNLDVRDLLIRFEVIQA